MDYYSVKQNNWLNWLRRNFKEFLTESIAQTPYKIVDIIDDPSHGKYVLIQVSGERFVFKRKVKEAVLDDKLITGLSTKEVRALTYLAAFDDARPEYEIVQDKLAKEIDKFIIGVKSRFKNELEHFEVTEISSNKELVKKFNQIDSHRIGYMSGVADTVKEYQALKQVSR